MAKFLIRYTHVEETTYEQWVEANNQTEALERIEEEANFETVVKNQGLEIKGYKVIEQQV